MLNNFYEYSSVTIFFSGVILVNVSFSLIRQKVFVTFRFTKSSSSIRPGCWTTKEPVSTSIPIYLKLNYGTSNVQLAEVLDGEHNLCDKIYPTYQYHESWDTVIACLHGFYPYYRQPLSLQGMSACLASTISEWIISFLTCIYVATFTPEFKYFELIKAKVLFHELTRNNEVPGNENSEETQSNGTVVTTAITETSAKY